MSDSATPWTVALQAPLSIGILQARILEWLAMPSSRGSSQPWDRTHISYVSCFGRWVLGTLAPCGRPYITYTMYKFRPPWWLSQSRIRLQFRRPGFDPWVGKIPLKKGMRREWQSPPVSLPRKSHQQKILAGYSPWGCKDLDTTTTTMYKLYTAC